MADVRLIDANALLVKVAHRNVLDVLANVDFERSWIYATVQNDMFKTVEKAPTIDAVPVVHGWWKRFEETAVTSAFRVLLVVGKITSTEDTRAICINTAPTAARRWTEVRKDD